MLVYKKQLLVNMHGTNINAITKFNKSREKKRQFYSECLIESASYTTALKIQIFWGVTLFRLLNVSSKTCYIKCASKSFYKLRGVNGPMMWKIKAIIKNKLIFKIMDIYCRFPITSTSNFSHSNVTTIILYLNLLSLSNVLNITSKSTKRYNKYSTLRLPSLENTCLHHDTPLHTNTHRPTETANTLPLNCNLNSFIWAWGSVVVKALRY